MLRNGSAEGTLHDIGDSLSSSGLFSPYIESIMHIFPVKFIGNGLDKLELLIKMQKFSIFIENLLLHYVEHFDLQTRLLVAVECPFCDISKNRFGEDFVVP